MPDNTPLLIVLLSQVLFVSFYYPQKVLGIVRQVIDRYPPLEYGKLYPVSTLEMQKAQQYYKVANLMILAVGLALVSYSFTFPSDELLGWDSQSVLLFYFLLQSTPLIFVVVNPGFSFFNLARKPSADGSRIAEFERRRLTDFVSPKFLFLACITYVAFVLSVITMPELWGAGYWNILYVTLLNVVFVAAALHHMYGKKHDPHQSHGDRLRRIKVGVNVQVFSSIGATLFLAINVGLQNYAGGLQDIATSAYFQLAILSTFVMYRIDDIDFEVYKEPASTDPETPKRSKSQSGTRIFFAFVSTITFIFIFIFWHARDDGSAMGSGNASPSHREAIFGF